jgi:hypothetical protein
VRWIAVRLRGSLFDIALSFPAAGYVQSDDPEGCKKLKRYKKFPLLSLSDLLFCCGGRFDTIVFVGHPSAYPDTIAPPTRLLFYLVIVILKH